MHKQVILVMQGGQYPFGQFSEHSASPSKMSTRTLVRKVHQTTSLQDRNILLDKISAVRQVEKTQLIAIESVLEEEQNVHILYQYVPFKATDELQKKGSAATLTLNIYELKQQVLELGDSLAEEGILLREWDLSSLGIDRHSQAKFYVDLDKIQVIQNGNNPSGMMNLSKQIRHLHFERISRMFDPLLGKEGKGKRKNSQPVMQFVEFDSKFVNNLTTKPKDNPGPVMSTNKHNKQIASQQEAKMSRNTSSKRPIAPFHSNDIIQTPSSTNIRRTKQDWKQIEQDEEIMNDFINVLDDEPEEPAEEKAEQEERRSPWVTQQQKIDYEEDAEGESEVDEEEVVWASPEDENGRGEENLQRSRYEEVVWEGESDDLMMRVQQAIQRSKSVMEVFRSITRA